MEILAISILAFVSGICLCALLSSAFLLYRAAATQRELSLASAQRLGDIAQENLQAMHALRLELTSALTKLDASRMHESSQLIQQTQRQTHGAVLVAHRKEKAGLAVKNHLGQAADAGGQDRHAAGHGLQGSQAETLREARHEQEVGAGQQARRQKRRQSAQQMGCSLRLPDKFPKCGPRAVLVNFPHNGMVRRRGSRSM